MSNNTVVMYDSPDAVEPCMMQGWRRSRDPASTETLEIFTLPVWLSSNGRVYMNEHDARYDGCTHRMCSTCNTPISVRSYCRSCYTKQQREKYDAMPEKDWDGASMIYSDALDRYFSDLDDIADYINDMEDPVTMEDLSLIICEPNYVPELTGEYCCDELPDDGDVPTEVEEAIDAFNKSVAGIVLSWSPGKYKLKLSDEVKDV